jgi:hypothetical protein
MDLLKIDVLLFNLAAPPSFRRSGCEEDCPMLPVKEESGRRYLPPSIRG